MSDFNFTVDVTGYGEDVDKSKFIQVKDGLTAKEYFNTVKDLMQQTKSTALRNAANLIAQQMKKTLITKQAKLAEDLMHRLEVINREIICVEAGYDTFVYRTDLLAYIKKVNNCSVRVVELENYRREIPDHVVDMIVKAQQYFDKLYVFFTDYTNEESRKIKQEERDKDPIVFGVFYNHRKEPEIRLYYVVDWIDETCDLTLEQLCRSYENENQGNGMLHKVEHDYNIDIETFKIMLDKMKNGEPIDTVTVVDKDGTEEHVIQSNGLTYAVANTMKLHVNTSINSYEVDDDE